MYVSLDRIILYVQDVERLTKFTRRYSSCRACELALHRVGKPYRIADKSS
jgi:hypothetical protein